MQRFESGEHAQFGARPGETERTFTINGVTITYGQMIAMADMVPDFDALNHLSAAQLRTIIALIERQRTRGVASVSEQEWISAAPEYLRLATHNVSHFAPAAGEWTSATAQFYSDATNIATAIADPTNHRAAWYQIHSRAMNLAWNGNLNDALARNAFGDHFLTDAFAAGHLINKQTVMDRARHNLTAPAGFERRVADRVLADPRSAPFADYEIRTSAWRLIFGGGWHRVDAASLADLLDFVRYHNIMTDDAFINNFAKAVHDRLNAGGVEVTVRGGAAFQLVGDKFLARSPQTLLAAQQAVARSRQDILDVRPRIPNPVPGMPAGGAPEPNYQAVCDTTWQLVPVATASGQRTIDDAINTLTDPSRPEAVNAFAEIILSNVNALIQQLAAQNLARRVTTPAATTTRTTP